MKLPIVSLALILPIAAQSSFDVASVKRSDPGHVGAQIYSPSPGRLTVLTTTLKDLVQHAYNLRPSQVQGGGGWTDSEVYDIAAKAPGPISNSELRQMLQALLADRFQLKVRRETREIGVYNLVVDKKGPRLEEVAAAGRGVGLQKGDLNALGADMATLASVLSRHVDRVVIDRTGIKGYYNFALKWTVDDADPAGAALFAALQDQLGLKLEPARAPVEVLTIERAERPSQN